MTYFPSLVVHLPAPSSCLLCHIASTPPRLPCQARSASLGAHLPQEALLWAAPPDPSPLITQHSVRLSLLLSSEPLGGKGRAAYSLFPARARGLAQSSRKTRVCRNQTAEESEARRVLRVDSPPVTHMSACLTSKALTPCCSGLAFQEHCIVNSSLGQAMKASCGAKAGGVTAAYDEVGVLGANYSAFVALSKISGFPQHGVYFL